MTITLEEVLIKLEAEKQKNIQLEKIINDLEKHEQFMHLHEDITTDIIFNVARNDKVMSELIEHKLNILNGKRIFAHRLIKKLYKEIELLNEKIYRLNNQCELQQISIDIFKRFKSFKKLKNVKE